MYKYKYLLGFIAPILIFISLRFDGIFSYSSTLFLFGLLPIFELVFKNKFDAFNRVDEEEFKSKSYFDILLYCFSIIHFMILFYYLDLVSSNSFSWLDIIGKTIAAGTSCGIFGINLAHELGHRLTLREQWLSKLLLMTSLYMHFFIEHNRGHHKHVSTDHDAASALQNQSIYTFYFKSIVGSFLSAFELERERLARLNISVWSIKNEFLQFILIQMLFSICIFIVFGNIALIQFFIIALIGILLLESVNYIQHYGLRRDKLETDQYERVNETHSWNADEPLGRIFLFELSRHSDHHKIATRKYQILKNDPNYPQLPTGYPGSILLALLPPLWFRVMKKRIEEL